MHALDTLIHRMSKLPGLGPRSARRLVLHLLKRRDDTLTPLIRHLEEVKNSVQTCTTCFNLDTQNPCYLCTHPKRANSPLLCIVADVSDVWALEKTAAFQGHYHVLGGLLSAVDGVTPQQLNLDPLYARLNKGEHREVLFALNATIDAQTTMHYIISQLPASLDLTFSSLAQGVPLGGELDYLDQATLSIAFEGRKKI